MEFGQYIKKLRKEKGLTVRELARRSGISHPYLSQLETGKNKNPGIGILIKLSKAMEIDLIELQEAIGFSFPENVETENEPLKDIQIKSEQLKDTFGDHNSLYGLWLKTLVQELEINALTLQNNKDWEKEIERDGLYTLLIQTASTALVIAERLKEE